VPVLLRLVTRLAHSRAAVQAGAAAERPAALGARPGALHPDSRQRPPRLRGPGGQAAALRAWSEAHPVNRLAISGQGRPGILVSGIGLELPGRSAGRAAAGRLQRAAHRRLPAAGGQDPPAAGRVSSEVTVVEEGYPFIER
jgi:hypothetical protein